MADGIVDAARGAVKHYRSEASCLRLSCLILRNLAASGATRLQVMRSGAADDMCKLMKPVLRSDDAERIPVAAAFCGVIRNLAIAPENRLELLRGRRKRFVFDAVDCVVLQEELEDEGAAWAVWRCLPRSLSSKAHAALLWCVTRCLISQQRGC